ncbi:MAG: beta-lactamase class [Patescibacteria group bacterium]|nr:beta-lactamase class [Patescibacteria group bacterium]
MHNKHRTIKLIAIILFTIILCITIVIFHKNIKLQDKLIQPIRQEQGQKQETNIPVTTAEEIAKTADAMALAKANLRLATIVDPLEITYDNKIGAVIIDLSNNATATINADQEFVTASIYKLFVAYGIYHKIDAGMLSLDKIINSNGAYRTINQCLDLMITISDNSCGYSLGKLYGWAELDTLLAYNGYISTMTNNYDAYDNLTVDKHTTANDVALLLQRLYNGDLLSKSSTDNFIGLLKASKLNNWLPSGLPENTVIAHKVGTLYGYVHDAGIIYGTKKDIVVVLLTGQWNIPATEPLPVFITLANKVWGYMNE